MSLINKCSACKLCPIAWGYWILGAASGFCLLLGQRAREGFLEKKKINSNSNFRLTFVLERNFWGGRGGGEGLVIETMMFRLVPEGQKEKLVFLRPWVLSCSKQSQETKL